MVVCSHCYHENPDDAGHCEVCSAPLPTQSSCPNCGATVLSDANFCGQCGTKLRSGSDSDEELLPMFPSAPIPLDRLMDELASEKGGTDDPAVQPAPTLPLEAVATVDGGGEAAIFTGETEDPSAPPAETLTDAEAQWLAEDDEDDDLDDLELSWEAPAEMPSDDDSSGVEIRDLSDFDAIAATVGEFHAAGENAVPELAPEPVAVVPTVAESSSEPPEDVDDLGSVSQKGELGLEPESSTVAESVSESEPAVQPVQDPDAATVLQSDQKGQLLHLQTNTPLPLPRGMKVVHIGKANTRIPPDIDVSAFPHAEIVSRVHADVHWDGQSYYLEDTGSANGTYVNSWPLPAHRRYQLRNGDRITLGKHDLISFIFQIVS